MNPYLKTPEEDLPPFIGRTREIRVFQDWLRTSEPQAMFVAVNGIPGMGKSTLLRHVMEMTRLADVPHIWVEGRSLLPTPQRFLDYLHFAMHDAFDLEPADGRFSLGNLLVLLAKRPFVLLIDNCDDFGLLEGWFRETFLRSILKLEALVVVASQQSVPLSWLTDDGLRSRTRVLELQPWTPSEVLAYAERFGDVDRAAVSTIVQVSGGIPLTVVLTVDGVRHDLKAGAGMDGASMLKRVDAHILGDGVAPALRRWLEGLAVLPDVDVRVLETTVGEPLSDAVYQALASLPVVAALPEGLSLHDSTRAYISQALRQRDPKRYSELRQNAVTAMVKHFADGDSGARYRTGAHLLRLYRDSLPQVGSHEFRNLPETTSTSLADARELEALHEFVMPTAEGVRMTPERTHRWLDALAVHHRESVQVVRPLSGEPLGFWICLWLHRDTVRFLHEFDPDMLSAFPDDMISEVSRVPREYADSLVTVTYGVNRAHPLYSEAQISGAIMLNSLPLTAAGLRAFFPVVDQDLLLFLKSLGFRPERVSVDEASAQDPEDLVYTMYQVDNRGVNLASWYQYYFSNITAGLGTRPSLKTPLEELPAVLERLRDAMFVHHSELARSLALDGQSLQQHISALLSDKRTDGPQISDQSRRILVERYLSRSYSVTELANHMHVSRASFYRHLTTALDELYRALQKL